MPSLKKLFSKHPPAAWLVLILSLCVTYWAWFIATAAVQQRTSERFRFSADDVAAAIHERMEQYELALRGGLALFEASEEVSRREWQDFADTLYLNKHFPGIQGLGYSVMLQPNQLREHEAAIQSEGFVDYHVKPEGVRDTYSAIVFLEPFDWRNQRAFGYDMYSEPTRREAMQRARDTASFAASGRVTLVQETNQDKQYGFLMYLPLYKKNAPLTYVEERREALQGYVYAAFRMGDLMHGILGNTQQNINFELYEGAAAEGVLLYNNAADQQLRFNNLDTKNDLFRTQRIEVGGKTWSLFVYADEGFVQASESQQPTFIVILGILLDIFLFYLISYLAKGRNQAKASEQRALADLQVSQQRLQLAADAAQMGLVEWSIVDNRMYWDERMLELYDYTAENLPEGLEAWKQRLHPDDKQATLKLIEEAQLHKKRLQAQFRIVLPNGNIRHIAASFIIERNAAYEAVRIIGFNYDITQQNLVKQEMQEKSWRLQSVIEATHVGSWEWNIQTGEMHLNERWAEIIGYATEELEPVSIETWQQFIHPEDQIKNNHALQAHFSGETDYYQIESRLRHRDGQWIWVMARGKVFSWTADGKPLMMFGTNQDISEQKHYEKILKSERDKAELANRARGEFLANMSHEIRTPINGVMGAMNLLQDSKLSATQHNLVDISKRSAESLLGLINDILDLSKIESGKLEIVENDIELLTIINDVARSLSTRAEAKDLELLCPSHYVDTLDVVADGLRLRQVLTNLVNNAIKFTQKGHVLIHVDVLNETKTRQKLRFSVDDTGQGIPHDKQAALFKRFEQADSSLTRKEGGTGLGLAISKQLVELMGGEIGFTSEPNKGSTFWFELELRKSPKQPLKKTNMLFDEVQVCVVTPPAIYTDFYKSVFSAWKVDYASAIGYQQAIEQLQASKHKHQVLIIDAAELINNKQQLNELLEQKTLLEDIFLLFVCPQSTLAIVPQVISDQADLIISKPLIQSELYNALLEVVSDGVTEFIEQPVKKPDLSKFDAEVLIVEDNATNVIIIEGILHKFNVSTTVADNGEQALSLLAENEYDLVLMDCQMPVMDGYETTRRIRGEGSQVLDKNIAVVALTAHAMQGDEEQCLAAGMNDYLTKPVDPQLLNQKLDTWLPARCKKQLAS
jgi:PAS domain S-box-containing protein